MGYYPDVKRNEGLTPAATWLDPEDVVLTERSQTHEHTWYMIPPA